MENIKVSRGRPKNYDEEKTKVISFRVYSFAHPQIKDMINKLSILDRTKLLIELIN